MMVVEMKEQEFIDLLTEIKEIQSKLRQKFNDKDLLTLYRLIERLEVPKLKVPKLIHIPR